MAEVTRLSVNGAPGMGYGSFAYRAPYTPGPRNDVTRLSLNGGPGANYGSFAGRAPAITEIAGWQIDLPIPRRRRVAIVGT